MTDSSGSSASLPRTGKRSKPEKSGKPGRPSHDAQRQTGNGPFPDEIPDHDDNCSRGTKAYQLLRHAIATGKLKPGARVMESELAAALNMSRTPVREAIATLEADGLISMDPARGRVVTKLDYQAVMEMYAVREVLESTAAGLAARNASEMEILALREMLEIEEQILNDGGKVVDHNRRFHEAIYHCSHNRYILKMLEYLQTAMLLLQPAGRTGNERRETALLEHRAVVEAIEARDPSAAEVAIRSHLRRAQQARIKLMLQNQ